MNDPATDSAGYDRFTEKKGLNHEVKTMPRWKKILLSLSLLVGLAGLGTQMVTSMARNSAPQTPTAPTHVAPGSPSSGSATPGSGFVSGQPAASTPDSGGSSAAPSSTPDQNASEVLTPYMTRVGFSVFIGVVVGFIFRTFVKIAATITAIIVAIAVALSYFHVINLDLTQVKAQTATASTWIADQGNRLKAMVFHSLPSTTGAGAGFFFGFKRR